MSGVKILGTGRYAPEFIATNDDFTNLVDTSDEWIQSRTGMQRRHISMGESTWLMGAKAAQKAMDAAGKTAADIDAIICTTATADYYYPSTACLMQKYLGIKDAFAFDITVACAGLAYSLDMARRYLYTGDVDTVLLVASENLTQHTNYEDRNTCVLFGDAAGALVVERGDTLFASYLFSAAEGAAHIYNKHARRKLPFEEEMTTEQEMPFPVELHDAIYMNGREVYKYATRLMPLALKKACERAGIAPEDLDLVIPHQANLRIIETVAKNLKMSMDKIYVNIQEYGNTSSATIAVCVDECIESGRIKRGDKVGIVSIGSGLALGANVFVY